MTVDFNPRSHEGSDRFPEHQRHRDIYFNPRSHEGSDGEVSADEYILYDFNPRSHEGSDPVRGGLPVSGIYISIHAPTRGATYIVYNVRDQR